MPRDPQLNISLAGRNCRVVLQVCKRDLTIKSLVYVTLSSGSCDGTQRQVVKNTGKTITVR